MAEVEEIVEQVTGLLSLVEAPASAEDLPVLKATQGWEEVAGEYARLCREANGRLRRCADYLRRGMRSEAVHLAMCQPHLLEMAAMLQLSAPSAWARLCARSGLPVPPQLLTSRIDELNAALAMEQKLEPLLARHRVLALAKAPTCDRLEVLRLLAAQDPQNPLWPNDIRTYELVRLREMRAESKTAFRNQDAKALDVLWNELMETPWLAEVPTDFRLGLQRAMESLTATSAMDHLELLLAELTTAFESNAVDWGQRVMDRWQQYVESRQIVLPEEMRERIRPVVTWLALASAKTAAAEQARAAAQKPRGWWSRLTGGS